MSIDIHTEDASTVITVASSLRVQTTGACEKVQLSIVTDRYGSETSWKIYKADISCTVMTLKCFQVIITLWKFQICSEMECAAHLGKVLTHCLTRMDLYL